MVAVRNAAFVAGAVVKAAAALAAVAAAADDGFYFDYGFFYPRATDKVVVEVYVAVPLEGLTPAAGEGGVTYNFNVGVHASRLPGEEAVASRVVSKTATVAGEREVEAPLSVTQVNVAVPPGDYRFKIGVGDLGGGGSRVTAVDLSVPPPPETGPFISSVELASSVAPVGAEARGEFVKAGLSVIPNPTKLVNDGEGLLPIYYELYRLSVAAEGEAAYVVRYDVSQLNGRRFVHVERMLEVGGPDVVRAEALDLTGVPPGSYELTVRLETRDGEEVLRARKEFMVYHQYSKEELVEFEGRFMPYSREEEEQLRKELVLVASEAELAAFDALPAEEKPIFVESFWARRDPDKDTSANEFKNVFYQRYYYVQEHYTTPFREGVYTDMGRVYLKHGEPDDVIRSPMGMRSHVTLDATTWQSDPFEAWEYHTPGGIDNQYVLFVFMDRDGDGAYELEGSTLPGYGRLLRAP